MNTHQGIAGKILISLAAAFLLISATAFSALGTEITPEDSPEIAPRNSSNPGRQLLSEYAQLRYGEESSIPVVTVKTALQTSDGFLWFGGYQGLMRFNGIVTKRYTPQDGFPSSNINVLFEDSRNRLWIGTNDSGVVLYENKAFTVYDTQQGLPSLLVRGIGECTDGNIYIATSAGLATYTTEDELVTHPVLADISTIGLTCSKEGRMMTLTTDGSIILFNRNDIIETYDTDYFGISRPNSIYMTKSGVLYIGTMGNELYMSDLSLTMVNELTTGPLLMHNSFFEDSKDRVWISAENGAGYIENGVFIHADGLIVNNQITQIIEDSEGSFWFCTMRSGIIQAVRTPFRDINFLARLGSLTANAVVMRNGDLYIGTEYGLVILRDNEPFETVLTGMLEGISIRHLLVDSKNRLWISTADRFGIIMVDTDGSLTFTNVNDGLLSNQPRVAMEASNGDIYIGLYNGISVIRDDEVLRNYTQEDGLANDSIMSLTEASNGVIYAGSEGGGLYAISDDIVSNFSEKDGLPSGTVYAMAPVGDGILVSTGDKVGFFNGRWIRIIDTLSFFDNYIFEIKVTDDNVWLLGSNALVIADAQQILLTETPDVTLLHKPERIAAEITAGLWSYLGEDGYMHFCTSMGVFGIDTRNIYKNTSIPSAAISEIYADGIPVDFNDGHFELPRDAQRLSIHIALLSFISEGGTISYMLEGFETDFITSERINETVVNYTNLSGGEYTFHLYGITVDGRHSELLSLPVRKTYALTEMTIFYVLVITVSFGAVAALIRLLMVNRAKTLENQRNEYMSIASRLMEVAAEMSDLKGGSNSNHSQRVAKYSVKVGKRLGMTEDELYTLYYSALLHDVGMVSIPGYILFKNGELTEEEYEIVKTHVDIGYKLLEGIDIIGDISLGAKYHHERIDGKGYKRISGDDIPLMAKIICVCNALDSMLTEKPYRRAMSANEAQSELLRCAGKQFDERVTAALISLIVGGEVPT